MNPPDSLPGQAARLQMAERQIESIFRRLREVDEMRAEVRTLGDQAKANTAGIDKLDTKVDELHADVLKLPGRIFGVMGKAAVAGASFAVAVLAIAEKVFGG